MSALPSPQPSPIPADDGRPPHLLVVDDDPHMVAMLEDVFELEGIEVTAFTSAAEARHHLADNSADIVIADIRMPEVSGLELLREIRERSPATLTILITGFSTLETTLEAVELGAFDYLTKPFMLGEVRLVVSRGLEQLRITRENERLRGEVARLEEDNGALRAQCESLARECKRMRDASTDAHRMWVPQPPLGVLRASAPGQPSQSVQQAQISVLDDLRRRGLLSDADFEKAKTRLTDDADE